MAAVELIVFQVIVLFWSLIAAESQVMMTRPGCDSYCGNISIPYPFGMKEGCYLDESFKILCTSSSQAPKLTVNGNHLEVRYISVRRSMIRVMFPIVFENCGDRDRNTVFDLEGSPFVFSSENYFVATGCGYFATMTQNQSIIEGRTYVHYRRKIKANMARLGVGVGFGALFLLIGLWWLYRVFKRKRSEKLKKKYFKRNGGLLLQEQLSSGEVNVEKIKMFPSKELDKATDHYNVNRTLGQGGQGTVYKGMLADGKIVAVKKSKVIDEGNLRQFINEVVLLSQINHRNVVKLLGCCLETEVPLLVYEFIPNGTLFQFLHDPNEEFPLTWEMRLRIAAEVAGALFYLHSAASLPIFHRDIKSTNILLDEKYRAKVADFGTSRSVSIDQTHVTTLVQGTFGYLDPEYFQSSQFTDKSDVYSFGVVLVELLTGQKAISFTRSEEQGRSLATYFIMAMESNCLFDILDPQVVKQGEREDVLMVASLARSCLRLNGKERPPMKEVTMVLERLKKSENLIVQQENEHDRTEVMGAPWDVTSASTISSFDIGAPSSLDEKPLLHTY
ncbi:hypothetical protein POTOM_057755 [Populus tomentosa]|uniref:Protein kinase domain-containing protein n=1 Tax=Populus tomentosa TaxID=118781 RepID=A0A8X7Y1F1_POPTO|nr:hypothetical protein POTOM_057755 [Populus tomentosa]